MFNFAGWASDLRTVSEEMIAKRILRTGDGSHEKFVMKEKIDSNNNENESESGSPREDLWGWGKRSFSFLFITKHLNISDDKEMSQNEKNFAKVLYKSR